MIASVPGYCLPFTFHIHNMKAAPKLDFNQTEVRNTTELPHWNVYKLTTGGLQHV